MKPRRPKKKLCEPVKFDPTLTSKHVRITHILNDPKTADPGTGDTDGAHDTIRFLESHGFKEDEDGVFRRPIKAA